jgi:hypothetical protein
MREHQGRVWAMTLDEFKVTLAGLPPGKAAHVPYDVYETLFAPGKPDDGARNEFAKANGCVIENRPRTAASDGLILQFWQPLPLAEGAQPTLA